MRSLQCKVVSYDGERYEELVLIQFTKCDYCDKGHIGL